MPKMLFDTEKEFSKWLEILAVKRDYSLYIVTESVMLTAVPLKSTDPINYGLYKGNDLLNIEKLAKELTVKLGIPLFKVRSLEFADFRTK